jgi:hypothetical protein
MLVYSPSNHVQGQMHQAANPETTPVPTTAPMQKIKIEQGHSFPSSSTLAGQSAYMQTDELEPASSHGTPSVLPPGIVPPGLVINNDHTQGPVVEAVQPDERGNGEGGGFDRFKAMSIQSSINMLFADYSALFSTPAIMITPTSSTMATSRSAKVPLPPSISPHRGGKRGREERGRGDRSRDDRGRKRGREEHGRGDRSRDDRGGDRSRSPPRRSRSPAQRQSARRSSPRRGRDSRSPSREGGRRSPPRDRRGSNSDVKGEEELASTFLASAVGEARLEAEQKEELARRVEEDMQQRWQAWADAEVEAEEKKAKAKIQSELRAKERTRRAALNASRKLPGAGAASAGGGNSMDVILSKLKAKKLKAAQQPAEGGGGEGGGGEGGGGEGGGGEDVEEYDPFGDGDGDAADTPSKPAAEPAAAAVTAVNRPSEESATSAADGSGATGGASAGEEGVGGATTANNSLAVLPASAQLTQSNMSALITPTSSTMATSRSAKAPLPPSISPHRVKQNRDDRGGKRGREEHGRGDRSRSPPQRSLELTLPQVKVAAGPLAVHETENAIKIIMPTSSTKNYVGRILGPRGATLKAVQAETGCTVCIRGRGSIRNKEEEERSRGTFGNEHLEEPLHVLVRGLSCR